MLTYGKTRYLIFRDLLRNLLYLLYATDYTGRILVGKKSCIHQGTILEAGNGAHLKIGENTHIQPNCHIAAHVGSIVIGNDVQIAQSCGFYSYDHGVRKDMLIRSQPLTSRGDILIGDDVWIGFGAKILNNVSIGRGAVIAAGSTVTKNIDEYSVAAGSPAKVIGERE